MSMEQRFFRPVFVKGKKVAVDGPIIPVCKGLFTVNLAGLTDKPNFHLLKLLQCNVQAKVRCQNEIIIKTGILVRVATDFIELQQGEEKVTLLQKDLLEITPDPTTCDPSIEKIVQLLE